MLSFVKLISKKFGVVIYNGFFSFDGRKENMLSMHAKNKQSYIEQQLNSLILLLTKKLKNL